MRHSPLKIRDIFRRLEPQMTFRHNTNLVQQRRPCQRERCGTMPTVKDGSCADTRAAPRSATAAQTRLHGGKPLDLRRKQQYRIRVASHYSFSSSVKNGDTSTRGCRGLLREWDEYSKQQAAQKRC